MRSQYHGLAVILSMLLPTVVQAAVGSHGGAPAPARYRDCLNTSSRDPAAALADAEDWAKAGGGVPANHCAALALVNLGRYGEAASRLDLLAKDRAVPAISFRVALYDQAGNAWLLAGDGARAVNSFSAALVLSPSDPDLFADLARAQAMRHNWHEVDLDMNAALALSPRRPDLLVLRASARRALGQYEGAAEDLAAALKLKPRDGDALVERGLLRKQLGDLGGARRDFQNALKTASGETAAQARQNLADLNP